MDNKKQANVRTICLIIKKILYRPTTGCTKVKNVVHKFMKNKSNTKANISFVNFISRKRTQICFLFFIALFSSLFIQESKAQNRRVNLTLSDVTLNEAIKAIEQNTEYVFFYKNSDIDLNRKVSVKAKNASIKSVMTQILPDSKYKIENSKIIILPKGQQSKRKIAGTITDDKGEPVIGANIMEKGTTNGTITSIDGSFSLEVASNAILHITSIGYKSQEIKVGNNNGFKIKLIEDSELLDEVVVVGYGTQKRVNLTGAIAVASSADIKIKPVGQTSVALQGVLPGVTVTQRSGEPGADSGSIRIRGIGTLSDANPLVLIDGVEGSINNIDPNLIESVSVLKDAASAAIYGSRAANGVVLVTTKRGSEGQFAISYTNYLGWQEPTNMPDIVDAVGYMTLLNVAYKNVGRDPLYSDELIEQYKKQNGVSSDDYPNTDWQKKTLTKSGFQQSHFLNISGGNEKLKTFTSLGYFTQDGLIENSSFKRLNLRNNMDWKFSSKLKAKVDLQFTSTKKSSPSSGAGNIFIWMNGIPANQIGINSDGSWGVGWNGVNPISHAKDAGAFVTRTIWGSINTSLIYSPFSWLTAEVNVAPKYTVASNDNLTKAIQSYLPDGNPSFVHPTKNSLTNSDAKTLHNNVRATLTAEKNIGDHNITVLAGASQEERHAKNFSAYRDSIDVNYPVLNTGSVANQSVSGGRDRFVLRSFFARANYNYKQKYLFEFNIRRDGSSRFAKGNKWATFPSASVGWRISEEKFMRKLKEKFLDDLKLRVSWGKLGNQNVGSSYYPFTTQMVFGVTAMGNQVVNMAVFSKMPNSLIKWETTESKDIGLDMTLFNKLNITADYYQKETRDILLTLPIPYTIGLDAPVQNAGVVENKGWELGITYRDKIGDLQYSVNFNLSDVKNKITDLRGQNGTGFIANREGHPINSIYGYIAEGYFQSEEEIANSATQVGTIKPGDIKYRDLNGDNRINGDDKVVIGSTIPRYTFGLNIGANYKGIDLSMFFQGVGKADGYLQGPGIVPFVSGESVGGTVLEEHKDYWTENNRNAAYPRLAFNESNNNQVSTFWLKDASYLRLKNLQVGYTLPVNLTKKWGINHLRFFANGTNLFTLDKFWKGYNVEAPTGMVNFYPQVKVYSFGLEVKF